MREEVHAFLIRSLGTLAITESFAGRSTAGIAEANKAISNAFNELTLLYGKDGKQNVNNQAR